MLGALFVKQMGGVNPVAMETMNELSHNADWLICE